MKTPWINYKKMKEVVCSKQIHYTEWAYQTELTNKIDHESQLESTCEILNSKIGDENSLAEEPDFAALLDTNHELPIPLETNVENEIVHHFDTEEADETNPMEELNFASELDSNRKFDIPSDSDAENKMMRLIYMEEMEKNNSTDFVNAFPGSVCSIAQKSQFSTHIEIDDFLHAPICGEFAQNTFEFLDLNNHLTPQIETKLFNTTMDYPEQPDCRLVRSKINGIMLLMKTDTYDKHSQKNNLSRSVVVPLHNTLSIKKGETNNLSCLSNDFMHIRVPVVVGEYKIELCLEENIVFEKGIVEIKDISNEVVLTNCRFVPIQFSRSLGNGTCTALKGNLFIEGYISQNIEYTESCTKNAVPAQNESLIHSNQLCQNIVLELIIHMLQVQKIRVSYDSQGSRG